MTKNEANASAQGAPSTFVLLNEIGIINQLSSARFEAVLPEGLNLPQFSVLNNFVRLGGTRTPAELADAFQVTRGAMTNTLQRLESKGCVQITKSASDGRSKEVRITAKGRRLREASIAATAPELKNISDAMGIEAIEQILPVLQKLRSWLDTHR